jgi:glyoxylase-like metal-dependent hydrolase (beta-lactamase superfamily II)
VQFVVIQEIVFQGLMIDPDSMHHLIRNLPRPSLLSNVGLSATTQTTQAVLVDPGRNPTRILREFDAHELPAPAMWHTHVHFDHLAQGHIPNSTNNRNSSLFTF